MGEGLGNKSGEEAMKEVLIILEEITWAIKNLKLDEAAGPDGIENDFLKTFMEILTKAIKKIINQILTEDKIPGRWRSKHAHQKKLI